jgi:hypothetical protein
MANRTAMQDATKSGDQQAYTSTTEPRSKRQDCIKAKPPDVAMPTAAKEIHPMFHAGSTWASVFEARLNGQLSSSSEILVVELNDRTLTWSVHATQKSIN